MSILPKITWPTWMRNLSGDNFYDLTSYEEWCSVSSNLQIAEDHPILTPALLFDSKLFSQAEFKVRNKKTKKIIENHWASNLLNRPNHFQTQQDFLESLRFMIIAQGVGVVYQKRVPGFNKQVEKLLIEGNVSRKKRSIHVDTMSATLILQNYLDRIAYAR